MKIAIAFGVLACAGSAMAQPVLSGQPGSIQGFGSRAVLVDQTLAGAGNFVDQQFGDFPAYATGIVDDMSTGGQTWDLTRMTTYFTNRGDTVWGGITTAQLTIFSKSGSAPTGADFPFTTSVAVTMTNLGTAWAMSADLSGVGLAQGLNGDFWIGLTPTADFGVFGQEFHIMSGAAQNGDGANARNAGGGFGLGTDWINGNGGVAFGDMTMLVEGNVVPAPSALALLSVGGLMARRRRR